MPPRIGGWGQTCRVTMATTADPSVESRASPGGCRTGQTEEPVVSRTSEGTPDQLELVTDEYALALLGALGDGPERGRDLIEGTEGSRSTVYRRLNRLVEAGFVRAETTLDPDGHHCKEFRFVRSTLTVTVENGDIRVTAEP